MKRAVLAACVAATLLAAGSASAVSREEVVVKARAYAIHQWSATSSNQAASCSAKYKSLFPPDDYVGLPYGWGGYMSLFTFDQRILQGYGAGAQATDGVLSCIAGVDCSGFVSQAWGIAHNTTSSLPDITSVIPKASLLPGDVLNKAGYHVALFTSLLADGSPSLIEAAGYNTHFNAFGGWSYVDGYTPRRHASLTGTTAGNPVGTTYNPISIGALPYSDSRNTQTSASRVLDGCNASAGTAEKGPEFIYKIDVAAPGALTATISDDATTDVDVYLLEHLNTTACKARGDTTISEQVGCGTYYLVVDSYGSDASKAGPYTLNVSIAASGQACGAVPGPSPFNPKGKLGDACAYPGNRNLPSCNPNLGAETCIYGSSSSFCSKACDQDSECSAISGGCCRDIGKGEKYCHPQSFCDGSGSSSSSSGGRPDGTSSGGTVSSGGEEGEGAGDGSSGAAQTTTTSGCGVSGRAASPWALAAFGLALAAVARRRRR